MDDDITKRMIDARFAASKAAYTIATLQSLGEWLYARYYPSAVDVHGPDANAALESFVAYALWLHADCDELDAALFANADVGARLACQHNEAVSFCDIPAPSYAHAVVDAARQFCERLEAALAEVGHPPGRPTQPLAEVLIRGNLRVITKAIASLSDPIDADWIDERLSKECVLASNAIAESQTNDKREPDAFASVNIFHVITARGGRLSKKERRILKIIADNTTALTGDEIAKGLGKTWREYAGGAKPKNETDSLRRYSILEATRERNGGFFLSPHTPKADVYAYLDLVGTE